MVSEGLNLGESHPYTSVDIPKMKQGGLNAGFFAVFAPARSTTPLEAVKQALKITGIIVEEVKRHPKDLFLAVSSGDVLRDIWARLTAATRLGWTRPSTPMGRRVSRISVRKLSAR